MTMQSTTIFKSTVGVLRLAFFSAFVMISPILATASDFGHDHAVSSKLVQIVRVNTAQFINVNNLRGTGYAPAFGCVSGPDHGAMGIHLHQYGVGRRRHAGRTLSGSIDL